jgi:hypothetical protein
MSGADPAGASVRRWSGGGDSATNSDVVASPASKPRRDQENARDVVEVSYAPAQRGSVPYLNVERMACCSTARPDRTNLV